jgi:hypothetical protein
MFGSLSFEKEAAGKVSAMCWKGTLDKFDIVYGDYEFVLMNASLSPVETAEYSTSVYKIPAEKMKL